MTVWQVVPQIVHYSLWGSSFSKYASDGADASIGVPGRSNLGGRRPVARKNFLLISKKTSKIRQKNAKNSGILPEFLAFCPNFFKTGGAAAPPAPLANTPMDASWKGYREGVKLIFVFSVTFR